MRAARKTPEEQYQMVMECRRRADCDWCRKNGINPETFYTWIRRLRKKGGIPILPVQRQPVYDSPSHDIVRVDVLPEEGLVEPVDGKNMFISPSAVRTTTSCIEIEVHSATFRLMPPCTKKHCL